MQVERSGIPSAFFRSTRKESGVISKGKEREKSGDNEKGGFLLCRNCRSVVTSTADKMDKYGRHTHTFTNPGGYVYRIGCFSGARGIINQGIPTREFTWFSGHTWCYSLCRRCFAHLGWFFQGEGSSFFGLILDNLIEEKKEER